MMQYTDKGTPEADQGLASLCDNLWFQWLEPHQR